MTGNETGRLTNGVLADAIKARISMRGQALLQWGFEGPFCRHSLQMPEEVVDQILAWRDAERVGEEGRKAI